MGATGTSAGAGYNPPGPRIEQQVQASGLPFTGLDLVPLLGVSLTLMLVGIGMHRLLGTRG
jgi:hypothetical protein